MKLLVCAAVVAAIFALSVTDIAAKRDLKAVILPVTSGADIDGTFVDPRTGRFFNIEPPPEPEEPPPEPPTFFEAFFDVVLALLPGFTELFSTAAPVVGTILTGVLDDD